MAEDFPDSVTLGEDVPDEQKEAFEANGRKLFAGAKKRFHLEGRAGAGSADAKVLDRARYRTKEGEIVTISDSAVAMGAEESVAGSVSVTIETPLSWSFEFPNAYVRETFTFTAFARSEMYDYMLGVNEYTLDGDPIIQGHVIDDVRDAYPESMSPFQSECTPEHFADQMLTMDQLRRGEGVEVGCEPNPYYQIHRG